ncbi:Cof-type HAD-IIB family hydrolase [Eremococcus coleocola]|uniref:Cof-like hydrolase n=1 Tax=Eremococcus coleocola ACS-139-V-Col8 TaxID=908337 RepID=E4KQE6_9LACT|nr:Cof-type HAD-IIB family hydrolase [Eremococcus coleocola]EFR30895.1 Cof-like hydrolase [Eremococcus coleocola ACS-139-V-Col8]
MQQHLIAIDLDGTTLNDQSQLSEKTIETLRKLDQLGHLVCIVTGRPYRNSRDIYRQIGLDNPIVNFNGAYCHYPSRPAWLGGYHYELDKEIAFDLLTKQDELGIDMILAEGKEQLYSSNLNIPDSPFFPKDSNLIASLNRKSLLDNPTALTILCAESNMKVIEDRIIAHYGDSVSVRTWGGVLPLLEVIHAGIYKNRGVQAIADFYHIPLQNILAFGDENNDLEMLQYAGLGVAMKNAVPEVLAVADAVTDYTNDQDGLALFLEEYFNLK